VQRFERRATLCWNVSAQSTKTTEVCAQPDSSSVPLPTWGNSGIEEEDEAVKPQFVAPTPASTTLDVEKEMDGVVGLTADIGCSPGETSHHCLWAPTSASTISDTEQKMDCVVGLTAGIGCSPAKTGSTLQTAAWADNWQAPAVISWVPTGDSVDGSRTKATVVPLIGETSWAAWTL